MAFEFIPVDPRVFYGDYEFIPGPLINWQVSLVKDSKDEPLYLENTLELEGLLPDFTAGSGAFSTLITKRQALVDAVSASGKEFKILNFGSPVVSGIFPTLESVNFEAGTWADRINYSVVFTYNESINDGPVVQDFSETWSFQENEDRRSVTVVHDISAVGINTAGSGANNALSNARTYVLSKTSYGNVPTNHPAFVQASGLLPAGADITAYEGLRSEAVDVNAGSFQVTENFILSSGSFTHLQTGQFQTDAQGFSTVTIDGNITGLGRGDFAFINALSAFNVKIEPTLTNKALELYSRFSGSGTLYVSRPQSRSISQNEFLGTISYNRSYTDNPESNLPSDIQDASVSVTNNEPTKAYATIPIFSRTEGPIVQDTSTTRPGTYTISGSVTAKTGSDVSAAAAYATTLINDNLPTATKTGYTLQTIILTQKSVTKDSLKRTVNFNLQWQYTSASFASDGLQQISC